MRWFSLLCLGLIATVGVTGCGSKGGSAPAPTKVSIPATPDGTITAVASAVADGKLEAVWQAMPESYQGDIKGQIEHFAEHMDGEVWTKAMGIVAKFAQLLETKQDLILGNAMVSQQLTAKNMKPEDVKASLTAIGGLLNDIQKDVKTKEALGNALIRQVGKSPVPTFVFWSLTRIGSRMLFYGPLNLVVHPQIVEGWLETLLAFVPGNESEKNGRAFCLANLARLTGQRALDIDDAMRQRVLVVLRSLKIPSEWTEMVERVIEMQAGDRGQLFGESLPIGLKLAG